MNNVFSPHLFEYNLRGRVKGLAIWFVSAACTLAFMVLLASLIIKSGMPDFVGEMLTALPDELSQNFKLESLPSFGDYRVDLGLCLQALMILGSIYACYLGISSIKTSEDDGTLIFAYSQGLSRVCIVITHYIVCAVVLILFNAGLFCLSMWIGLSNHVPELLAIIMHSFVAMLITELLYMAVGILISTFMRDITRCASTAMGIFLLTFFMGTFGYYTDTLSFLKVLGPYHYYSPYMFCTINAEFDTSRAVLIAFAAIVFVALAALRLLRRDLIEE